MENNNIYLFTRHFCNDAEFSILLISSDCMVVKIIRSTGRTSFRTTCINKHAYIKQAIKAFALEGEFHYSFRVDGNGWEPYTETGLCHIKEDSISIEIL